MPSASSSDVDEAVGNLNVLRIEPLVDKVSKLQEQVGTLGRGVGRHNSQAINHAKSCLNLKVFGGKGCKEWRDTFLVATSGVEPVYRQIFDCLEWTEEEKITQEQ